MERLLGLNIFHPDGMIDCHIRGEIMVRWIFNVVMVATVTLALFSI